MFGWITFAIALGIVISVHETAHAIMAKWVGLHVGKMSIGFPGLFSFWVGKVQVSIGPILIWGATEIDDLEEASWLQTLVVCLVGPIASSIFGIVLLIQGISFMEVVSKFSQCNPNMVMWAKVTEQVLIQGGIRGYFGLVGVISLAMGIMNLIPIPPLDGGGALFAILEGVFGPKIKGTLTVLLVIGTILVFCCMLFSLGQEVVGVSSAIISSPSTTICP